MSHGKWGFCSGLKYCVLCGTGEEVNRVLVSVPKKFFKRAVRRNLLKRRIRESYRTQKDLLKIDSGVDMMFVYDSKEIMDFGEIKEAVGKILSGIQ